MALGVTLRVSGIRKLQKNLAALEESVAKGLLTDAALAAGRVIRNEARNNIPIGNDDEQIPSQRGKHLRDSLKVLISFIKKNVVRIAVVTGTRRELGIQAGDKYYYPAALELGTEFIAPRSYLRSALREKASQALRVFGQVAMKLIDRQVKKAA